VIGKNYQERLLKCNLFMKIYAKIFLHKFSHYSVSVFSNPDENLKAGFPPSVAHLLLARPLFLPSWQHCFLIASFLELIIVEEK
jgi:hypothetical protein